MATITGTAGDDSLVGTDEQGDLFILTTGADTLIGGPGGGALANSAEGLIWNDIVVDLAAGTITAPGLVQSVSGVSSIDIKNLRGSPDIGDVTLIGDAGSNDFDVFRAGSAVLEGGEGADRLSLGYADGSMSGGAGDDDLSSSGGNDNFITLEGGSGFDRFYAFAYFWDTTLISHTAGETVVSIDGNTITLLDEIEAFLFYESSVSHDELISALSPLTGTDAGEALTGTPERNLLEALGGNDWITATTGADSIDGGAGTDMLSFLNVSEVTVNLGAGNAVINASSRGESLREIQQISNIENITGSSDNDILVGDAGANLLRGLGGRDSFYATAGGMCWWVVRARTGCTVACIGIARMCRSLCCAGASGRARGRTQGSPASSSWSHGAAMIN